MNTANTSDNHNQILFDLLSLCHTTTPKTHQSFHNYNMSAQWQSISWTIRTLCISNCEKIKLLINPDVADRLLDALLFCQQYTVQQRGCIGVCMLLTHHILVWRYNKSIVFITTGDKNKLRQGGCFSQSSISMFDISHIDTQVESGNEEAMPCSTCDMQSQYISP